MRNEINVINIKLFNTFIFLNEIILYHEKNIPPFVISSFSF
jgi:hypothetical protein